MKDAVDRESNVYCTTNLKKVKYKQGVIHSYFFGCKPIETGESTQGWRDTIMSYMLRGKKTRRSRQTQHVAGGIALVLAAGIFFSYQGGYMAAWRIDRDLAIADQKLERAIASKDTTSPEFTATLGAYIDAVHRVSDATASISSGAVLERISVEAFKQLTHNQLQLRLLMRRAGTDMPLSIIDEARYENMVAQEAVVQHFTDERLPRVVSEENATREILSCPECNIIMISLTTLRKDHIGLYGYDKPTTPAIDSYFKNSLIFQSTLAPSAWTVPDAVSLFTSLFPYRHGVVIREQIYIPLLYNSKVKTFAEILKDNGYSTAAFTGGGDYNDRLSGLARGFEFYLDEQTYGDYGIRGDFPLGFGTLSYAPLRSFVKNAGDWMQQHRDKKFFLFVQGYDTHCPYAPHEPYASRFTAGLSTTLDHDICYVTHGDVAAVNDTVSTGVEVYPYSQTVRTLTDEEPKTVTITPGDVDYMRALYDARIAEVDDSVGTLLRRIDDLGLGSNTIVILMSEHGEMLGENGWFMRGGSVRGTAYAPALNFPLIIKHPRIDTRTDVFDPVQTVDIMPTLLSILGINDVQAVIRDGKPLAFSVFGDKPVNAYAYGGTIFIPNDTNQYFADVSSVNIIKTDEWKLIRNAVYGELGSKSATTTYELYNLKNDPKETTNLYSDDTTHANILRSKLDQWMHDFAGAGMPL